MDFEDLTSEQKEKVKACTSPEEMLELARKEGYELTDEQLEGIAGGWRTPCPGQNFGDTRDDIHESMVPEAFMSGEIRGDELD